MALPQRIFRIAAYTLLCTLIAGYFAIPSVKQNININNGRFWDTYDPSTFYKLLTVDKIVAYNDSLMNGDRSDTFRYVRSLATVVSSRFYHGYSHYSFRHNWISYTTGKLIWKDMNAVVIPNDILQHSNAACSQVSIVMAACMREAGITYRKVSFVGHFALEARVNGRWCFLDTNLEPELPNGCYSLQDLLASGEIYRAYRNRLAPDQFSWFTEKVVYGKPNEPLAPRAALFHRISYVFSVAIPLLLLLLFGYDMVQLLNRRIRQREQRNSETGASGASGAVAQVESDVVVMKMTTDHEKVI